MKYVIVVDDKDFNKHVENVIITHDDKEVWKDMVDVEYIKKHMKSMINKKYPRGSDLFNDYVNGWNSCINEVLKEK